MSGIIAPFVIWNLLYLNPYTSSMKIYQFGLLIVIHYIFSGTLIVNIVEALPIELLCLFSSEVSFATFLCLAFAIAHDLHTGNITLKRFILSRCAVFLVMSSLRCPRYS